MKRKKNHTENIIKPMIHTEHNVNFYPN